MPKINDWNRVFWTNSSGDNTYNPEGRQFPDDVLAAYENEAGDVVTYGYAPESPDEGTEEDDDSSESSRPDYQVELNGEVPEGVILDGEDFPDEELEQLVFGTRAQARSAASQMMRQLVPLAPGEDGEYVYADLQEWARFLGLPANLSKEEMVQEMDLPEPEPSSDDE